MLIPPAQCGDYSHGGGAGSLALPTLSASASFPRSSLPLLTCLGRKKLVSSFNDIWCLEAVMCYWSAVYQGFAYIKLSALQADQNSRCVLNCNFRWWHQPLPGLITSLDVWQIGNVCRLANKAQCPDTLRRDQVCLTHYNLVHYYSSFSTSSFLSLPNVGQCPVILWSLGILSKFHLAS